MDINKLNFSELETLRARLAKSQNQRMRRLEKAGKDYGASYNQAKALLDSYGKKRFSESKTYKGTRESLINEIKKIRQISEMKTATVKGMKDFEKKMVDTYGGRVANLSDEDIQSKEFYEYISSEIYKELNKVFGSDELLFIYNRYKDESIDFLNFYVENNHGQYNYKSLNWFTEHFNKWL